MDWNGLSNHTMTPVYHSKIKDKYTKATKTKSNPGDVKAYHAVYVGRLVHFRGSESQRRPVVEDDMHRYWYDLAEGSGEALEESSSGHHRNRAQRGL